MIIFQFKIINIIINYIKELLLCIGYCINKYIMDTKYTSPYELCLYSGIFSLCLNLATLGFFRLFYKNYFEQCREYFAQINNSIQLLFFFIFLIGLFLFNLCDCFSVKVYSPNYIINIFIVQQIYHSVQSQNILNICISIILGILFFFLFLIFNEIIEINCFGLQKNTKKNIKKRAIMEEEENNETNDDDDKDDNKSDNDDNDDNDDNANPNPNSQIERDNFYIELEKINEIGVDIENDM